MSDVIDVVAIDRRLFLDDIWKERHFNISDLSQKSGVSGEVILMILRHKAVQKNDAIQVLDALSLMIGLPLNLDTVRVLLLAEDDVRPTFREIQLKYNVRLEDLYGKARVPYPLVLKMAQGQSVERHVAMRVLRVFCQMIKVDESKYTLDTVQINTKEELHV